MRGIVPDPILDRRDKIGFEATAAEVVGSTRSVGPRNTLARIGEPRPCSAKRADAPSLGERWHKARPIRLDDMAVAERHCMGSPVRCRVRLNGVDSMPSALPSAAVLSFSPLHRDARVQRQIRALMSTFKVTAMGYTDPCIEGVQFVDVGRRPLTTLQKMSMALRLKAGLFEDVYRSQESVRKVADALGHRDFALIVANDINTLPIALLCRGKSKILFDAHEYSPREFEDRFLWRFFLRKYIEYLCRTRISQADAMVTVGPTIAQEYAREFGVRPAVVMNAPVYHAIPREPREREVICMVHHGGFSRSRRLESMIETMTELDDRFRLDFMLISSDPTGLQDLKTRASGDSRISFVPPVAPEDIVTRISSYDIGLCTYAPHSFNGRYALPNKFFDCLQARLAIAIGPLPEMKRLVERYKCGVVARDFTPRALAEVLRNLDRRRVEAYRRAADVAAATLCYENSERVLLDTVERLLGHADAGQGHRADLASVN